MVLSHKEEHISKTKPFIREFSELEAGFLLFLGMQIKLSLTLSHQRQKHLGVLLGQLGLFDRNE